MRRLVWIPLLLVAGLVAGCGGSDDEPDSSARVRVGDGTAPQAGGYRLTDVSLPAPGGPGDVTFQVVDRAGQPLTSYTPEQTEELHLYVVRSDLAHFRHLYPTRSADGTWTARVALATPGSYRVVVAFTPGVDAAGPHVALGDTVLLPGAWDPVAVTAATAGVRVSDGVVAVEAPAELASGADGRMTLTVSDPNAKRVALGSDLGRSAHLTGFDVRTGAFVHADPDGGAEPVAGGDALTFRTGIDRPGTYRFFLQVRVDGFVHQVPFTATVT